MNFLDLEILPTATFKDMHMVEMTPLQSSNGLGMSPYLKYSLWCLGHESEGMWTRRNSRYYFTLKEDAVLFALSV